MKAPRKPRRALPYKLSAGHVTLSLNAKTHGLEPILGAAYLMMDRAFVSLSGERSRAVSVFLRPKTPGRPGRAALAGLAESFLADFEGQKLRWAVSRNNLSIREHVAEQAVLLSNGRAEPAPPAAPAEAPAEQLTGDQRAEIERLIAEVESEISAMNEKKAVADPKDIKAPWEARQEKERKPA